MKNKTVFLIIISFLGLILLLSVYTYLDRINIGTIIGVIIAEKESSQKAIARSISSVKMALLAILSFALGKMTDIYNLYEHIEAKRKEYTPSLTFEVIDTTNPRVMPPKNADEIIALDNDGCSEKIYILCAIRNKGNTDLTAVSINQMNINCASMESGLSHIICLCISPNKHLQLFYVRCQNSENVFYQAKYHIVYNKSAGTANIVGKDKFKKVGHDGK